MSESTSSESAPSAPEPLTPDALESLLSGTDHEAFVAFVADLRERAGWTIEREGSVLTATRPGGERKRLLVWTDDRSHIERLLDAEPDAPDAAPIDAVVTRDRDAGAAVAIAEDRDAGVIDPAALHDRLLYAIDRESARALCETHFERTVEPRPASADPDDADSAGSFRARALLIAVVLLAVGVAGAAGLPAGPFGAPLDASPDGFPVTSPEATPPGGTPPTSAPVAIGPATPTPPPPEPSTPEGGTDPGTPEPGACSGCPTLLDFGDDPPTAAANAMTTVTATLRNPYPFGLSNVSVALDPPAGNWTVSPAAGTTFPALGPGESISIAWEISVPPGAAGNRTLGVVSVYADGQSALRTTGEYAITIAEPGLRPPDDPPCTAALGPLIGGGSCHLLTFAEEPTITAGTTTTITGTLYNPREYDLVNGSVALEAPENWTITPANETTFDRLRPGEARPAAWNVTPPVSASGTHTITGTTNYTRSGGPGRANRSVPRDYRLSIAPAEATQPPDVLPCRLDSGPVNAAGPCYLLTFPDDSATVVPGETTTVTGRLYNPREYALANGSVELAAPGTNWRIAPVRGTTFDRLAPGEVQLAQWNVSAPASASGTVDVRGVTNYTRLGGPGNANVSLAHRYPVEVIPIVGNVTFHNGSGTTDATSRTDAAVPPAPSARVAP